MSEVIFLDEYRAEKHANYCLNDFDPLEDSISEDGE